MTHNILYTCFLLQIEYNIDGRDFKEIYYEDGNKPCGIPSELADVVIRVLDFCGGKNIDLEKIILEKMEYNESRPYKHCKKCWIIKEE